MPSISDALIDNDLGVIITVEVTTGSKRDLFPAGFNPWRKTIGCRVTAPAMEGRANKAVITLIAKTLDHPVNKLQIQSGLTSPIKRVLIKGLKSIDVIPCILSKK
ncbi:MAG: DUF167 domain-containing protein [Methanoregulaceae archaeon]